MKFGLVRRRPQITWIFLACQLLISAFHQASGETLIVSSGQSDYHSIQSAINAAQPGDTIQVQPGTYPENIRLNKTLTLTGMSWPVLRGTGTGSVLTVTADHCVIQGFVIEHSGNSLTDEDSGVLLKADDGVIANNQLRDVLYGIYLYQASRHQIRGNVITGRNEIESGERGAGLHLWNSAKNILEGNTISLMRDGLYIQTSPGNIVRQNRVIRLRYGLHYMNSDDNKFEDNIFSHNVAGAAIMYSRRIELRRNQFMHNRGFSSFGILFQDCEDIVAEDNLVIDNATGLFLEALRRSTFRRNVIAENDLAIQLYASSDRNLFTENNFQTNLSPLQLVGRRSTTRWQHHGRGNYWSDYSGYDLDADGIGDIGHKVQNVFEYLEGNFPRLRLYLSSAAAQSLAAAEKTFPIVKGSSEIDAAPLMKAMAIRPSALPAPQAFAYQSTLLGFISLLLMSAGITIIWKGQRA